jgi:AAA domain
VTGPRTNGAVAGKRAVARKNYAYAHAGDGHTVVKTRIDFEDGSKTFVWPEGTKADEMALYGHEDLSRLRPGEFIFFPEGEKNVDVITATGCIAVTNGGGSGQADFGAALDVLGKYPDNPILVLEDNDTSGMKLTRNLYARLRLLHPDVRWLLPNPMSQGGDVADVLLAMDERARKPYLEAIATLAAKEPPWLKEESEEGKAIPVASLREVLATPSEPLEQIVDRLLHRGKTSCLVGPYKAGKSTLLRILCTCIATGTDVMDRQVFRPHRVGYLSLEESQAEVKYHFKLLCDQTGDETAYDRIFIHCGDEWLGADEEERFDLVQRYIEERELEFLYLGPLQDYFMFRNINDYSEVKPALRRFASHVARPTNCHVAFDHHSNKYGVGRNSILGSVAIGAGIDQLLTLSLDDALGKRGLTTQQRYDGPGLTTMVGLEYVPNRLDVTMTEAASRLLQRESQRERAVQIALHCREVWLSGNAITQALSGRRSQVMGDIEYGVKFGVLDERERDGRGGGKEYRGNREVLLDHGVISP